MKQLVILSGKGGAGKTTVAAALAHLASQEQLVVMVDADVDAANLELVLSPTRVEERVFMSGQVAVIDAQCCIGCGRCAEVCRFEAVLHGDGTYQIDPLACEGCAACIYQCPAQAIHSQEQQAGLWFHSQTRFGPLIHAHLLAGQENSGKLVTVVKQEGCRLARNLERDLLLVDGPPGIGCPVIAASTGADLALLVAEPTLSGIHDIERALNTTRHFRVPAVLCINKADLNPARLAEIEAFCVAEAVPVVGRLPYDTIVTEAMIEGQPVTVYQPDGAVAAAIRQVWAQIRVRLAA